MGTPSLKSKYEEKVRYGDTSDRAVECAMHCNGTVRSMKIDLWQIRTMINLTSKNVSRRGE